MTARYLYAVAWVLFVLAIPPALVLTNVRLMVFDPGYYQRGYERHGVARSTGMTAGQLAEATAQVQAYFRGGPLVSLVVPKEWGREPLFNAREQKHLADVRDLLNLALRVQEAALVYLFGVAGGLLIFRRAAGAGMLTNWLSAGSGLTVATFALLGLLAIGDFDSFWTQFHVLSFSNDLWVLDPRTDYMIRLYPVPFWFDAVTDVVVRSVGAAVVLLLLAQGYLRRRTDQRPRPGAARPGVGQVQPLAGSAAVSSVAGHEAGGRETPPP